MQGILQTTRSEIHDFLHNQIEVVPGYYFDQYETIKRIHLYENSQFEDGSDYNGLEPLFFNVINYRRDNVARFLDVNTSDIRTEELNPQSTIASMLMRYKLRQYLKDHDYTQKINDMANYLATYGSVVLEKRKEGDVRVDLRRFFLDPTVNNIQDSRFVTIQMYLTENELREKARKNGWDKDAVERIIRKKKTKKSDAPQSYSDEGSSNEVRSAFYFEVYKRWGFIEKGEIDGTRSQEMIPAFTVVAEPSLVAELDSGETVEQGEVLFKSKWNKEYPFEEAHLIKTEGRWLGVGIFELLFPMQERFNELMNQRRVSMELSSMHLFQTADNLLFNNLLNDLQNGDVIQTRTQGSLQPIVNEERNLQAFQMEEDSYNRNADALSFRNDIISGEIPSSMPATNALLAQNNVQAVHLIKRQNFANFIRRYIVNNVMPQVLSDIGEEEVLRFVGETEDLFVLDENIAKKKLRDVVIERALSGNPVMEPEIPELEDEIKRNLKEMGAKRFVKVYKEYFENKQMDIDINIDSEQRDVDKSVQNTFAFINAFAQNPAALQDPVIREFALGVGRDIGINVGRMEMAFARRDARQAQQEEAAGDIQQAAELVAAQDEQLTEVNE